MFEELLARLAASLANAGIDYMVIGGQAILVHGEPRLTRDIDITLGVDAGELARVKSVAAAAGLSALVSDDKFAEETSVFPCRDDPSGVRVDFIFSYSPYERQAIQRSVTVDVAGTDVQFASAEDLIIHKCVAGRPRDLEDVLGVIAKHDDLDIAYIERWLDAFSAIVEHEPLGAFRAAVARLGKQRSPGS